MMCAHASAVPVESIVTGEVLAALCPGCDCQLPAEFLTCEHANVIDITNLGEVPGHGICNDCGTSAWFGRPPAAQLIVGSALAPEDVEALKARFRESADPHQMIFLPSIASLSVPTPIEIQGGP